MKTLLMAQGSVEWFEARKGVVTASEIDSLVTPAWKVRTGKGVDSYMFRKLAEKSVGWAADFGGSYQMDQGSIAEKIALPWFNFTYNADARPVGFCISDDGRTGCSPDAMIGDDNGLEIKFPSHPVHLQYLAEGVLPDDYAAQVHFSMYVTGFKQWEFVSFSKVFPSLHVTVKRNEEIQAVIHEALQKFFVKFDAHYAVIKSAQDAESAGKEAAYNAKIKAWENGGPTP